MGSERQWQCRATDPDQQWQCRATNPDQQCPGGAIEQLGACKGFVVSYMLNSYVACRCMTS